MIKRRFFSTSIMLIVEQKVVWVISTSKSGLECYGRWNSLSTGDTIQIKVKENFFNASNFAFIPENSVF